MSEEQDNLQRDDVVRQADDRLVNALLLHVYNPQAIAQREHRVGRLIRAIQEPAMTPAIDATASVGSAARGLRFPAWAVRGAWAAAAMVLIAAGIFALTYSPTPALASLDDILGALGRPGDRAYRIQMEDLPTPPGRRPPEDRPPEMTPKPGLNDATLYLRDGRQYLLVRSDPKGGELFDGYDGRQSWRIRDGALAETKEGLGAGGIPMPPIMADIPFSDLHRTLERVLVDYAVEQFDQSSLPSGGEVLRHVRVRRNSHEVKGPETIEIWADSKTALPKRIVFDRAKLQGNRRPCRLTFSLASDAALPADWFAPQVHVTAKTDAH